MTEAKPEGSMGKVEHPYSQVNLKKENPDYIFDTIEIPWGEQENYVVSSKLGRGKYAHVLEGRCVRTGKKVAIKVLMPIRPEKIKREYHILRTLKHPNIVNLVDIVKCSHLRTPSLIFEHVESADFRELCKELTLGEIRSYSKQLFSALDYMHSKGIMHRDIKPFNVLMNPGTKSLKVIDFGLSCYYFPTADNSVHVASTFYKAPELLLENSHYDYRVDCWAAGLILASMIFRRAPLIVGNDTIDQVLKVAKLMGTEEVVAYIKEYRLSEKKGHRKDNICFDILVAFENGDVKRELPSQFTEFINPDNRHLATDYALDLVRNLVVLDYKKRYTAAQALAHPFLAD